MGFVGGRHELSGIVALWFAGRIESESAAFPLTHRTIPHNAEMWDKGCMRESHCLATQLGSNGWGIRQLTGKPPAATPFARQRKNNLNCVYTIDMQTACGDSLAVAAGGLHAKGRLSFEAAVFGAIEPPEASFRALWDKSENSTP